MQAFHNDAKVKQFYVDRLAEHHRLDQIVQGIGFEGDRGCNVGCILHSYDHSLYPKELGLPEWYGRLCETIFEGLPKEKAPDFAMSTLTSIKEGVDIEQVRWKLAILRHKKTLVDLETNKQAYADECRLAINKVINYCQSKLDGVDTEESREEAESALWSAARSASRSAWSAVRSAAWSASDSAESASKSAKSAWSPWSARSAHFTWEAETLISLLSETK